MSNNDIEEQLCRFVIEARRQDGDPYPPQTVYALITGLQRYLRAEGRRDISFLTKSDPTFSRLRLSLDARMKQLTSSGVGSVKKQAQLLTEEHEAALWDKGVFSTSTSEGLLYVVFFYNCKLFGLRGGDEHRNLMREQFTISYDEVGQYLRFIGRSSKNVQGGLQQRKVSSRFMPSQHMEADALLKFLICILDTYQVKVHFTANHSKMTCIVPKLLAETNWLV